MSLTTPEKIRKLQRPLHAEAKGSPESRFYTLYDKLYHQDIVSCHRHSLKLVASVYGVNYDTIWPWLRNYNQNGLEGLRDKPGGHRRSKSSQKQWQEVGG